MKDEAEKTLKHTLLCLILSCAIASVVQARTIGARGQVSEVWPPERSAATAPVHVPQPGELLTHNWEFTQILYDADTTYSNYRNYLNAVPVSMSFAPQGRGFLATLHTVFKTTDWGRTWQNLDRHPAPSTQYSEYRALRAPYYVNSLAVRPVQRGEVGLDTVLFALVRADVDSSALRTLYYQSGTQLWPFPALVLPYWVTNVIIPDSFTACAIAGLDGRLYRNDTLALSSSWEYIDAQKGFIRSGRSDSLLPEQTWITATCSAQDLIVAVGSYQWISRDRGRWWRIRHAADDVFDGSVSFTDSVHGLTGGGTIAPAAQGWVHVSHDGARTWSDRVLETDFPIRAVKMVTSDIGFAAGGIYQEDRGEIWSTTDGGVTWERDLSTSAEIRTLEAVRSSAAYIDVVAAGVFSDFRGGVWRTRVYAPASSGPIIVAEPDTVDFGERGPNVRDSLRVVLRNIGTAADTVLRVSGGNSTFTPRWLYSQGYVLGPPDSVAFWVVLYTDSLNGIFTRRLTVETKRSGSFDMMARVQVTADAMGTEPTIPRATALRVWPNPGNAQFAISYALPHEENIVLRIYDLTGRQVETLYAGRAAAGEHRLIWNAARQATGIYFVRWTRTDGAAQTVKLLLLK
jgi:photosystem II stability/assembly factor-like uncharacterized protein